MVKSAELKDLIERELGENTKVIVNSEDNVHFSAIVISKIFIGVHNKVKRQQRIYTVLKDYISSGKLHAITMKTYSPQEWEIFSKPKNST